MYTNIKTLQKKDNINLNHKAGKKKDKENILSNVILLKIGLN